MPVTVRKAGPLWPAVASLASQPGRLVPLPAPVGGAAALAQSVRATHS